MIILNCYDTIISQVAWSKFYLETSRSSCRWSCVVVMEAEEEA